MKIAIDTQTTTGQKTGFGQYVCHLLDNLSEKDNEYISISPKNEDDLSAPKRLWWDQVTFPFLAHKNRVDIIHQPAFSAPIFTSKPVVVTVHDLIAVHFGHDIPFGSRQYFGKVMPFTYRFANHIIAVSKHTKYDIVKLLGIDNDKISVIYEAADKKFVPLNSKELISSVKDKYKTGSRYILHVGTLSPRKNLEFLVDAYAKLPENKNVNLVIAGKKGWYYENLIKKVSDYGLKNKVRFIGYIDEQDKVAIYNGAEILAFPSLYEGFGLPPLEAMSCGTPVVASDVSSIPEVVGDGGVLISPTDKNAWVKYFQKILIDEKLRNKLSQQGIVEAKKFSWKRTAQETQKVYKMIYENYC